MKIDEKEYGKVIANNLRDIMLEQGKTQAEVAKALGISKATLSSWMNGTRIPRIKNIDRLCAYFGVMRRDIMQDKKNPDSVNWRMSQEEYQKLIGLFVSSPKFVAVSQRESELLEKIRKLNDLGRERLEEQLTFLLSNEKFTLSEHETEEGDFAG